MIRELALFVMSTAPVAIFAQGTAPANPGNTVVMPGTNIYVVGGGLYGTGVYVVPGSTPGVAGVAAPGVAGISLAGRTGISLEQPLQLGVQSTLAPSWPVNPYAEYSMGNAAVYGTQEAASVEGTAPGTASDFGPSYLAVSEPQTSVTSLGEVAAYYKANRPQHVRTYTNADAPPSAPIVILPRTKSDKAAPQPAMPPPQQPPPTTRRPPP